MKEEGRPRRCFPEGGVSERRRWGAGRFGGQRSGRWRREIRKHKFNPDEFSDYSVQKCFLFLPRLEAEFNCSWWNVFFSYWCLKCSACSVPRLIVPVFTPVWRSATVRLTLFYWSHLVPNLQPFWKGSFRLRPDNSTNSSVFNRTFQSL